MYFENVIEKLDEKNKVALLDAIYMTKKELVQSVHTSSIKQLTGADKRWYTYVPDASRKNNRKEIKRKTEKEIIEYLLEFYGLDGMTFIELFNEYIPYKTKHTGSLQTIRRHRQHFEKYFVNGKSILLNMNIAKIDHLTLQEEANRLVKTYKMTQKEWKNVRTFFFGMFRYAYDKHWITIDPTEKVKITVQFRQEEKKTAKTEVFKTTEYKRLHDYLDVQYLLTHDPAYLAVKLQFYTGLRIGELVALRWENVDLCNKELKVNSMESNEPRIGSDGKFHDNIVIVNHTKNYLNRTIAILPQAIEIFDELMVHTQNCSGFVFTRDGVRITERQYTYILERYAELNDLPVKRSHKIRKTYASRLNGNKVPTDTIRRDLGHKHLTTTETYIYDPNDDEETYELKAKAV